MRFYGTFVLGALCPALICGCAKKQNDAKAEAPPTPQVVPASNATTFTVDDPAKFRLVSADVRDTTPALDANGVVQADVSRTVPVVSLASG